MGESQHTINRRTVTKGIAWSVPAVAVAGAAPAFAASPAQVTASYKSACKASGNSCNKAPYFISKGYTVRFEVCNYNTVPVTVTLPATAQLTINGTSVSAVVQEGGDQTFTLDARTCQDIDVNIAGQTDSADASIAGSFSATWKGANPPESTDPRFNGTVTFTAAVTATPPCTYPLTGSPSNCVPGAPTTRPL